jgi:hypothetical protein
VACDDIEENVMEQLLEATYNNPQSIRVTLGTWDMNTSTMKGSHVDLLDVEITDDTASSTDSSERVEKTDTGIFRR